MERTRRNPDTGHFTADYSGSYLNSSKYDLRYRNKMCKCSRTPDGQPGEKGSGSSCEKRDLHSCIHIPGICNRTVRSDDCCQKRIRISWICCLYHSVCPVYRTRDRNARKRNLRKEERRSRSVENMLRDFLIERLTFTR